MPKITSLAAEPVKLLLVGDPKSGKTSALSSLVKAGQRLFVMNFDGKTHMAPFRMFLTPEEQERVVVETFLDDLKLKDRRVMPPSAPIAFPRAMQMLEHWKDDDADYGSVRDWGTDTTLVIDTLTGMGKAAMWYTLFINGRFNPAVNKKGMKRQKDWGNAMELQENFLDMLQSPGIKCNVVVTAHLTLLSGAAKDDDDDDDDTADAPKDTSDNANVIDWKRFPNALGKKLPQKVGGLFGAVVEAKSLGGGKNTRKVLRTVPEPDVDIAVPALGLPPEIPLEGGLARIFEAVRQGKDVK